MISTKTHAIIDYLVGVLLIFSPYLFGFASGGVAQWLPQLIGALTIFMSLMTKYELSLAWIIPVRLHLNLDIGAGVLLALSPWLFGFADIVWMPHMLIGLMAVIAASVTKRAPVERFTTHAHG